MNSQIHQMIMHQNWIPLTQPLISCSVVHPGSSCLYEILFKILKVMKASLKMYSILYAVLLIFKLRKRMRDYSLKKQLLKICKNFIGSVLFISTLTGGMKGALCLLNNVRHPLDMKSMIVLGSFGAVPIYWEDPYRRSEISYSILVRSLRSIFMFIKKRVPEMMSYEKEAQLSFMVIFGILSYIYSQKELTIRNRNTLETLWGKD